MAKYNQLLRIEEELGAAARYAGRAAIAPLAQKEVRPWPTSNRASWSPTTTATSPTASRRWSDAVSPLGEVWVVAPDREQSAASHAISLHRPLRITEVRERWFAVDGTPTDCAYLAINHLLKDDRPRL